MGMPRHTSAVDDPDGLGLGVAEGAGADVVGCGDREPDVVGCGDREPDGETRADAVRPGLAEPCGCGAGMRLGETSGLVVTDATAVRCRAFLRAVTR
jgi:hypothetical protein